MVVVHIVPVISILLHVLDSISYMCDHNRNLFLINRMLADKPMVNHLGEVSGSWPLVSSRWKCFSTCPGSFIGQHQLQYSEYIESVLYRCETNWRMNYCISTLRLMTLPRLNCYTELTLPRVTDPLNLSLFKRFINNDNMDTEKRFFFFG